MAFPVHCKTGTPFNDVNHKYLSTFLKASKALSDEVRDVDICKAGRRVLSNTFARKLHGLEEQKFGRM